VPDETPPGGSSDDPRADEHDEADDSASPVEAGAEAADLGAALEPAPAADAIEAYHQRARLAEDRLAEVLAAYRKLRTENAGYRDRLTRNFERRFDQRRERLLLKFIEILDNLDRALDAAEESAAGQALIEGLILVRTQLLQTLQEEGLERIPALGLPYDPSFAESVGSQAVDDPDHHHVVVKELQRGYRLNGRVARPARVVIGEFTPAEGEPAAGPPPAPQGEEPPPSQTATPPETPSLEEIIARAEAQEALFPEVFGEGNEKQG
jgi:molecular chaperone GrpE